MQLTSSMSIWDTTSTSPAIFTTTLAPNETTTTLEPRPSHYVGAPRRCPSRFRPLVFRCCGLHSGAATPHGLVFRRNRPKFVFVRFVCFLVVYCLCFLSACVCVSSMRGSVFEPSSGKGQVNDAEAINNITNSKELTHGSGTRCATRRNWLGDRRQPTDFEIHQLHPIAPIWGMITKGANHSFAGIGALDAQKVHWNTLTTR